VQIQRICRYFDANTGLGVAKTALKVLNRHGKHIAEGGHKNTQAKKTVTKLVKTDFAQYN
jgi:hypothetical protein